VSVETASYPAVWFRKYTHTHTHTHTHKHTYVYITLPKISAVWNETPCKFLDKQERFIVIYCFHFQVIFQKYRSLHIHFRENPTFREHILYVQNVTTIHLKLNPLAKTG